MARRQLLTDDERRALLGVPTERDDLARPLHAHPVRPGSRGEAP